MKNILLLSLLWIIAATACKKEDRDVYYVKDYYTGEPVPNLNMSFAVSTGGGGGWLFGGYETKYSATSDNEGKFKLHLEKEDRNTSLWLNDLEIPIGSDSTNIHWKYYANDESLFGDDHVLKLKPLAQANFLHPILKNPNTFVDTIAVSCNSQKVHITKSNLYSHSTIFLLPNKAYTFSLEYIKNGISTFQTITYTVPTLVERNPDGSGIINFTFDIELPNI
jgi:hypothetical protein